MNSSPRFHVLSVASGLLALLSCSSVNAAQLTTVSYGTLTRVDSHTALNLVPGNVLYAINNAAPAAPLQVIDGVTFNTNTPGNAPAGYSEVVTN